MAAPLAALAKQLARRRAAAAAAGGGRGRLFKLLALATALLLAPALMVAVIFQGAQPAGCGPDAGGASPTLPGTWDGPGSLGGVLGTGVTAAELRRARAHPQGGTTIDPGEYRSTAYAPAAGGTNCASDCRATASGIVVDGGRLRKYVIASNPRHNRYGALVYVWPNPYGWPGPFVNADTGDDFQGTGRLDFYIFEPASYSKAMTWGSTKMVRVSSKPIVAGGPEAGTVPVADSSPSPTPVAPATGGETPDFAAAVTAAKQLHGSPVGFAVSDQNGRIIAEYHGDQVNTGRSISKSLVLVALLRKAKDRALTADERQLADKMIGDSDNGAANELVDRVGIGAVNDVARIAGMRQWNASAGRGKFLAYRLGTAAVSAADFARFFARVDDLMPARHRSAGVDLLANIRGEGRFGVLQADIRGRVLSKGGWAIGGGEGTVNQAAQITVGGKTYGVALVLGEQASLDAGGAQITTVAKAIVAGDGAVASDAQCPDAGGVIAGGPTGEKAAQIARQHLGKNGRAQPFKDFKPATFADAWCAWFLTNVWRLAGIDIPFSAFSGYPYTWAKAKHPDRLFKTVGNPPKSATPPVGSALMYGSGPENTSTSEHINMVSKVNGDGSIMLIGGNQDGSRVTSYGPCKLSRSSTAHLTGPGCDSRPVFGIVTPPGGSAT